MLVGEEVVTSLGGGDEFIANRDVVNEILMPIVVVRQAERKR